MQALVICGSRNHDGQTAQAAAALAQGLADQGVGAEVVFLPELQVERCRQCDADGWGLCRTQGRCTIADDFEPLRQRLRRADRAVFATPVYFADLSESMRAFLDRLRRVCRSEEDRTGMADKPVVGIAVAGGGGGGAPQAVLRLEQILSRCGFDVVDMVPVRRQNLTLKTGVLRLTGAWLAHCAPPE